MNSSALELSTHIGRVQDFSADWIEPYDAVYLGDPYCELLDDNILMHPEKLGEIIQDLKARGKKAYLTLFAKPFTSLFAHIKGLVEGAIQHGLDGVEVYETGTIHMMSKNWPSVDIHINGFMNILNFQSINLFEDYRVTRLLPTYELNQEEIDELKANSTVDMNILVFGKIPLGYAEGCILADEYYQKSPCPGYCYQDNFIEYKGQAMYVGGKVPMSAKDTCLLQELPSLISKGYKSFRVAAQFENHRYRHVAGDVFRQAIQEIHASGQMTSFDAKHARLKSISQRGLCNGFYHAQSGAAYVS